MTAPITYVQSKTLAAVKTWRATDKAKIAPTATTAEKAATRNDHRNSERKLRECADQLIKAEGSAP